MYIIASMATQEKLEKVRSLYGSSIDTILKMENIFNNKTYEDIPALISDMSNVDINMLTMDLLTDMQYRECPPPLMEEFNIFSIYVKCMKHLSNAKEELQKLQLSAEKDEEKIQKQQLCVENEEKDFKRFENKLIELNEWKINKTAADLKEANQTYRANIAQTAMSGRPIYSNLASAPLEV